jgi:hypothetical protein
MAVLQGTETPAREAQAAVPAGSLWIGVAAAITAVVAEALATEGDEVRGSHRI